ncbi:MAG TPA: alpha/beta hydrolase [Thermoleophilaceae bacterium]
MSIFARSLMPVLLLALLGLAAPRAMASGTPDLQWVACYEGFECATAHVPRDYARPHGAEFELALIRKPASDREHRLGSLFFNPGGPGGSGVDFVRFAPPAALERFSERYDLVGFDPRGVGASTPAATDCLPSYGPHFIRPETLDVHALRASARDHVRSCLAANGEFLPWLTTANVARDLDRLRIGVGDAKLNYLGLSYGGLIGETYTTLFPRRTGAIVIDSPSDGEAWIKHPLEGVREQEASFELSLDRFERWCALDYPGCPLGADDPETDLDALVERLNAAPIPDGAGGTVHGDDVLLAAEESLYSRFAWSPLAGALASAAGGDGSGVRALAGESAGALASAYPAYMMNEGRYPRRLAPFLDANEHAYALSPHFWWARGYEWAGVTRYPLAPRGAFYGPFRHSPKARTALVIGGTHDPAAPYLWARRYVADLGNARLLTYESDGHGAITDLNPCIVGAVLAYLETESLPAEGASCTQAVQPAAAALRAPGDDARREAWKRMTRF